MPKQQIIPTWLAWNNANFQSESGLTDPRTDQNFPAGGLGLGDYFDATEDEANTASYLPTGLLHAGRYRLVQVDSNANAALIRTGTIGFARAGSFVEGIAVLTPGTGGTPGTYNVLASPGIAGGFGALIQVVVGPAGGVTSASVLQGGTNYTTQGGPVVSLQTNTTTATGVTGVTYLARMNHNPNIVGNTLAVAVGINPVQYNLARPVVFLNPIAPGNFGFIQELGTATVQLSTASSGNGWGDWVCFNQTPLDGTATITFFNVPAPGNAIGKALDNGAPGQLIKMYLSMVPVVQD
jgi:hypothetical protein